MNTSQSPIRQEFVTVVFSSKYVEIPKKGFCCVQNCTSNRSDINLSFHVFPKRGENTVWLENKYGEMEKVDRFDAWLQIVKTKRPYIQTYKICSKHFTKDDYIPRGSSGPFTKRLKKNAVPSLNLPMTDRQKAILKLKKERASKQSDAVFIEQEPLENLESELENFDPLNWQSEKSTQMPENSITKNDQEVQVAVLTEIVGPGSVICNITTDQELNIATGLESFKVLDSLVEKIKTFAKADTWSTKMSLRDKIIMTYMKKKHNLSYSFLNILICQAYSVPYLKDIYENMTEYLALASDT